ncbi:MAG: O-Antigen ligase [Methanobacterium sp. PtaU1.Bin097]|nr:MAG: O-Antigen ligase [Methanobacterium sp. PtaU1.Bin097]
MFNQLRKYIPLLFLAILLLSTTIITILLSKPSLMAGFLGFIIFIGCLPFIVNRPHYLLYIMAGVIPLGFFSRIITYLTVLPILGMLLGLLWTISYLLKNTTITPAREYWHLFLLAILMTASSIAGLDTANSAWYMKTMLQLFIFTFLIINLIDTPAKLEQLGWVVLLSNAFAASIVLIDKTDLLPFKFTGEQVYGYMALSRETGTAADPNYFAMQLSVGLGFALGVLLYSSKSLAIKLIASCMFFIFLFGLLTTYSIGAMIGVGALFFFIILRSKRIQRAHKCLIFFFVILLMGGIILFSSFRERIGSEIQLAKKGEVWQLGSERVLTWTASANTALHNPFLGVGIGNSSAVAKDYDPFGIIKLLENTEKGAHNMYISFAADNGFIALFIFILLISSAYRHLSRVITKISPDNVTQLYIYLSTLAVLFSLIIQNFFLDGWLDKNLWLILGMSIATAKIYASSQSRPEKEN